MKVLIDTNLLNIDQLIHVYVSAKEEQAERKQVQPNHKFILTFEKRLKVLEDEPKEALSEKPQSFRQTVQHQRIKEVLGL